ncbi:MAG: aminotransferase class V-fold PLP-dependent enzyme [Bacteroidia bacterium]
MVLNKTNPVADSYHSNAISVLEKSIQIALETYSNVHRGSGHFSMVTNHLYEQAKDFALEFLGLNKTKFTIIFCTARNASGIINQLVPESFQMVSSRDIGLPLGVTALAVQKKELSKVSPVQTGGGTARLMSKEWVIWAKNSDKFEAGTPAIINIIAFAKALQMIQSSSVNDSFEKPDPEKKSADEILYRDELEEFSGHELLEELRKTQIGRGVQVPTQEGTRSFINFDNSASTPTFIPIFNSFSQAWCQSEQVKQEIICEVKSICAKTLGAPPKGYDVIFTSNATEAINLAAESFSLEFADEIEPVVLNTLLEHSSNELPWRMIPGCSLIRLSVNAEGFVNLNELETLLKTYNQDGRYGKKRIKLVAISGASNVLGVCQKISEISTIVHQFGARLLVDAAQLVAHREVNMEECGIDYLAFSAHKVYAPFGCGVLVARKDLLKFSEKDLELIQSSGEENAGGIAALGKALILLNRIGMELIEAEEQSLTRKILNGMAHINGLDVYGIKDPESPEFSNKVGVIPFILKNKMAPQVGNELALLGGIGVRTGCHCSHITVKHILRVGPRLEKFQKLIVTLFPKLSLPGVVRVSLGIENSEADVNRLIHVLGLIADKAKNSSKKEVQQRIKDFVLDSADRVYK